MAMTEWQDVGMNSEEKAQLQAIFDAVTLAGVSFEIEYAQNNNHNSTTTITISKNYKYLLSIMIANQGTKDSDVSSDDAGRELSRIVTTDGSTRNSTIAVYIKENVIVGDTITMFGNWENSAILIGIN